MEKKTLLTIASALLLSLSMSAQAQTYKDGAYIGTGQGKGGQVKVKVVVKSGKIADVIVARHGDTEVIMNGPKTMLPPLMIEKNTPDVDVIGGATESSNGIIAAVKNALSKAK